LDLADYPKEMAQKQTARVAYIAPTDRAETLAWWTTEDAIDGPTDALFDRPSLKRRDIPED